MSDKRLTGFNTKLLTIFEIPIKTCQVLPIPISFTQHHSVKSYDGQRQN